MRPQSIVLFERIVIASIALGLLLLLLNVAMIDDIMPLGGAGIGFMAVVYLVTFGLYGLLIYYIARRASSTARWIYVGLASLALLSGLAGIGMLSLLPAYIVILTLAQHGLTIASLIMLFRPDAAAWFAQGPHGGAHGGAHGAMPGYGAPPAMPGYGGQPQAPAWPPAPAQPHAPAWPPAPAQPQAPAWPPAPAQPAAPSWPQPQQGAAPPASQWPPQAPPPPPAAPWPPQAPAPMPTPPPSPQAAPAPAPDPAPAPAPATESPSSATRECPFCAEEIKAQAIKCRFCGSDVEPLPKG